MDKGRKKIVMIGPVYPYKGGIAHYTSLMYRALSCKYDVRMISYSMQYPKILFKKEQRDYDNKTFQIPDTKYWINTANPFNILSVAREDPEDEAGSCDFSVVAPVFCALLLDHGESAGAHEEALRMPQCFSA